MDKGGGAQAQLNRPLALMPLGVSESLDVGDTDRLPRTVCAEPKLFTPPSRDGTEESLIPSLVSPPPNLMAIKSWSLDFPLGFLCFMVP